VYYPLKTIFFFGVQNYKKKMKSKEERISFLSKKSKLRKEEETNIHFFRSTDG